MLPVVMPPIAGPPRSAPRASKAGHAWWFRALIDNSLSHFYNIISENLQEATVTEVGLTARHESPLTLAEEHVLLLWQVTAHASELLSAVAHGRWPAAELTALAGYAQAEVLRQVAEEEALLFPAVASARAAGLARDHARLRAAAELLARAAAGEQPMSLASVAVAVRDFVAQFERHLRNEEGLLAAGRTSQSVPGTASLGGGRTSGTRSPRDP